MTEEKLNLRLADIRRLANSLNGEGYTIFRTAIPSEACHDIRFLLKYIDNLQSTVAQLEALRDQLNKLLPLSDDKFD